MKGCVGAVCTYIHGGGGGGGGGGGEVVYTTTHTPRNSLFVKFISLRYMPTMHKSVKLLVIPNSIAFQFAVIIERFLSILY